MNNLVLATVQALATGIHQRQVSATEVLEAYLAQIAQHNPVLHAIVTFDEERARSRAQDADAALARGDVWGPLHGVPITIKDSIETAGLRTTSGFPPLADYVPTTDATVVARLRAAGAILLGKTNLPTLAGDGQSDNPLFGRSNNPWDVTRTPGGVMVPGGVDEGACDGAQYRIVAGHERPIHCQTLVDGWIGTALSPPRGSLCRRSVCPWPAGETGWGYAARGPGARPVCVPEACGAAAGHGWRACGRERPRPAGACRHGAGRQALASHSAPCSALLKPF